jgi:hypothetical protein
MPRDTFSSSAIWSVIDEFPGSALLKGAAVLHHIKEACEVDSASRLEFYLLSDPEAQGVTSISSNVCPYFMFELSLSSVSLVCPHPSLT